MKRETILKKAVEVVLEHGWNGVRLKEIAGRTGMTRPNLYHLFKSRDKLLAETLDWAEDEFRKKILFPLENEPDPAKAVKGLFIRFQRFALKANNPAETAMVLFCHQVGPDPAYHQRVSQLYEKLVTILCDRLEEGMQDGVFSDKAEPMDLACWITATLQGHLQLCRLKPKGYKFKASLGVVEAFLFTERPSQHGEA